MTKTFIMSMACILFVSCSHSKKVTSSDASLFQKWDLVSVNGQNITGSYRNPVYIEFDESQSRVSGSSGCNRYFGPFTKKGASIKFGPLAGTKMLCDDASNKLETVFLEVLGKVDAYKIEDNELLLLNNKEVVARFLQKQDGI